MIWPMGIFGKKSVSDEALFCSLLMTFAQSIEAVEKGNQIALNEAWDLFINTVGVLADGGIISESAMDTVVYRSNFPENHTLTLDLLAIRRLKDEKYVFVDKNKESLALHFSVRNIAAKTNLHPRDFVEYLNQITVRSFPSFGQGELDEAFSAVIGIYMMTLVTDLTSDNSSMTTRVAKRVMGYEFALQWLADWNLAKR
jgi:hypothetical protein